LAFCAGSNAQTFGSRHGTPERFTDSRARA
jgi:hypothetical protein